MDAREHRTDGVTIGGRTFFPGLSIEAEERIAREQPAWQAWPPARRAAVELELARMTPNAIIAEMADYPLTESDRVAQASEVERHDVSLEVLDGLGDGPIGRAIAGKVQAAAARVRALAPVKSHLLRRLLVSDRRDQNERRDVLFHTETEVLKELLRRAPSWLSDAKKLRDGMLEDVKREAPKVREAEQAWASSQEPFYPKEEPSAEIAELWRKAAALALELVGTVAAIHAARMERVVKRSQAIELGRRFGLDLSTPHEAHRLQTFGCDAALRDHIVAALNAAGHSPSKLRSYFE